MAYPVVHFEIGCNDQPATSAFYSNIFSYTIDSAPAGMINTNSTEGIAGHLAASGHKPQQLTHFYIQTDDVRASLQQVEAASGKTIVSPLPIPTGTCAWSSDLRGNIVGLCKPN